MEGERQVVRAEGVHIGKRPRDQLRPVDQEPRAPFPVRLVIAARVGQRPYGGQRIPGPQEVGRARAADQLGARVDQRRQVLQVQLAGDRVEPGQATLYPAAEPRQYLPAHRVPGDVVGVVLHQRRHHVVPVTELGEQRVHDCVDGLGGIPVERDAGRAGRPDEPRDRVVGLLEAPGHRGRGTGLSPVDVLVVRA